MSQFTQGHALLVGVGADLPVTVNDATGVADILKDPERCAYPQAQVTLLTEAEATRQAILDALDRLAMLTTPESTVVFYFSGHGYEITTITGKAYFLIPNGYDVNNLHTTAISGPDLMQKLAAIQAQKMLILFDCCHADGMDNEKGALGAHFAKAPIPAEAQEILAQGSGRVVIASSQADEKSYTGKPYSQFTMAMVEALAGAGVAKQDGYVRVADLAMYARERVPSKTKNRQHPVLHFEQADNFEVAYYAAGEKEPKGLPKEMERQLDGDLDETGSAPQTTHLENSPVAQGERSVGAGRDMTGNTVATGSNNQIDQSHSVFNQKGQTVIGRQTNIDGNVDSGGGLSNFGTLNSGDSNIVGRGPGTMGIDPSQLNALFAPLLTAAATAPENQFEAVQTVTELKEEAAKGEQADDKKMAKLIEGFIGLVPAGVGAVVSAFASPILGAIAGPATEYVIEKIQGE